MSSTRATDMPISDAGAGTPRESAAYDAALDAFRAAHVPQDGTVGIVRAYRAVQAMPYFSGPDRTPFAALRDGRGACTAKHLVLRDLLRRIGLRAEVEIIEGDFSTAVPLHPSMPPALGDMIRAGGVTDFHCRVWLPQGDDGQRLDATWPRGLTAWGFAADLDWAGQGDTQQAIARVTVRSRDDDVLGTKARLLGGLSEEVTLRRKEFLALLSGWMAGLALPENAGI